ncbi:hypothetical protein M8J77_001330 [Diaphorina citri]|nr:hypothetical protein M8J77_001330 [Diaphorina citri]
MVPATSRAARDKDQFCFLSANIEFLIDSISLFPEPSISSDTLSKQINELCQKGSDTCDECCDLMMTADQFRDPNVTSFSQLLFDVARDQVVVGASKVQVCKFPRPCLGSWLPTRLTFGDKDSKERPERFLWRPKWSVTIMCEAFHHPASSNPRPLWKSCRVLFSTSGFRDFMPNLEFEV